MQQRHQVDETRALPRVSDAPRLGRDEGRRGAGDESGMFGWGSDERRLEAITVLSSTATVGGGRGNQPNQPDQGEGTGMRGRGEQRVSGALDELVAMRRSSEKERPPARGSGEEEGGEHVRRDIWSMDIDDEEDEDFLGMGAFHATGGKQGGQAASALLDEAEAEWVIGEDRVLRPGSAGGSASGSILPDHLRGDGEQPRPGMRSGIQPILASRVVSRAEEEAFSRPGTSGSTGAWGEEEEAYPEFYGTEESTYHMQDRHMETDIYGDWEGEGGTVRHDRTNGLGSEAANDWHGEGVGKGEGISRFGAHAETDKPPGSASVPAFSAEDDLLGGILEEDEMLW